MLNSSPGSYFLAAGLMALTRMPADASSSAQLMVADRIGALGGPVGGMSPPAGHGAGHHVDDAAAPVPAHVLGGAAGTGEVADDVARQRNHQVRLGDFHQGLGNGPPGAVDETVDGPVALDAGVHDVRSPSANDPTDPARELAVPPAATIEAATCSAPGGVDVVDQHAGAVLRQGAAECAAEQPAAAGDDGRLAFESSHLTLLCLPMRSILRSHAECL